MKKKQKRRHATEFYSRVSEDFITALEFDPHEGLFPGPASMTRFAIRRIARKRPPPVKLFLTIQETRLVVRVAFHIEMGSDDLSEWRTELCGLSDRSTRKHQLLRIAPVRANAITCLNNKTVNATSDEAKDI